MCGIVGIININKSKVNKKLLGIMQNSIKHRGPDGSGYYLFKNVAIAMRRLSIIDVKGGNQPLFNEDRSIVIVGNGEIYNYLELQNKLKKIGHKFDTHSDIETIIHAYEEWGYDCFSKFRGMFAIAMIDIKRNKLIIARDRLGEKPLYIARTSESIYFSSEMKSLINVPLLDKTIDMKAIDLFFHYYFIPEPHTPFQNIKKVKCGSYVEIDLSSYSLKEVTFWDASKVKTSNHLDPTALIKRELIKACQLTLRSDVPIGIALSGGIDSGSILALSAPKYKKVMNAFSIGYEGTPSSDERDMARVLAKKFKVKFIEKEIKVKDVINHFPKLVWDCDDPIADIAAHSIFEVSKLAHDNGIKVLLGGNGGDEIFWGYPSTTDGLKKSLTKPNFLLNLLNKKTITYNNPDPKTAGFYIEKLYSKKFNDIIGKSNHESVITKPENNNADSIKKATLTNLRDLWLKSNVITLGDRMSMAASVELRSPFLDYKLIEVALSSKKNIESYKLGQKYYLKKAMQKILPNGVLNRPKKGFTPPVGIWIQGLLNKYGHLIRNGFLVKEKILDKNKIKIFSDLINNIPTYSAYQILIMEIWGRLYIYNEKI